MKHFSIILIAIATLSFTKIADEFLKQLGITKTDANSKISTSLLEGSMDTYGIKKTIALGSRTAVAKEVLAYTKQYVNSAAFVKEYNALREQKKPVLPVVQTPEDMQQGMIDAGKKSIADLEAKLKKADASTKVIFEKTLESVRKQLQQIEDPNNRSVAGYRNGYPNLLKQRDANYQQHIAHWESKYPANHQLFIKQRLLQFMDETKDIDFGAALYEKKGIKYFTNPDYERKSARWKMAFRAGKEVVEPARAFVQEWIQSLP